MIPISPFISPLPLFCLFVPALPIPWAAKKSLYRSNGNSPEKTNPSCWTSSTDMNRVYLPQLEAAKIRHRTFGLVPDQ